MPHRFPHRHVAVGFLILSILFYSPVLVGIRSFPEGDFTHHFLAFSLFQKAELLQGRLPLWNPYTYSGHPFLADPQAALFYPLNTLVMLVTTPLETLFDSAPAARLFFLQVEVVLHVALAGFFTYLLLHALTRSQAAGILAGVMFAFSGYLTGYPPLQLAVLRCAIWLPLILYFLYRAFQNWHPTWMWLGFIVATTCSIFAGHPQTLLYTAYLTVAWILFLGLYLQPRPLAGSVRVPEPERSAIARFVKHKSSSILLPLALCATAITGLSAVQLLPSWEFTRESVRANSSYEFLSAGFPLRDTWQLVLPGVFSWFSPLYVGLSGLGLAVSAFGVFGRTVDADSDRGEKQQGKRQVMRGFVLFFGVAVLLSLLLSYGRNSFLYPLFYRAAPGWDLFRQQERAAYLVSFSLCAMAGCGLAAIPLMPLPRRRLISLTYAALIIALIYGFGLLWQLNGGTVLSHWRYIGVAGSSILIICSFALVLWWEGWDGWRNYVLIAISIINLFSINLGTNLTPGGSKNKTAVTPEMVSLQKAVEARKNSNLGLSGRIYNEFRLYADYGMVLRLEDVWGSSPLRLSAYAELFEEFPLDRMWRLTGVEHVLTWRRELFEPSLLLAEFPQDQDTTYLHRLLEPNPMAWTVPAVRIVDEEDQHAVATALADHSIDLESIAFVVKPGKHPGETATDINSVEMAESALVGANIQLSRLGPGHLHVIVESHASSYLVLSLNYMSGWRLLNRRCGETASCRAIASPSALPPPFEINRTNLAFVGLTIPAGKVSFDLVYDPLSFKMGLWSSGLTGLILLVFAGVKMRTEKRSCFARSRN